MRKCVALFKVGFGKIEHQLGVRDIGHTLHRDAAVFVLAAFLPVYVAFVIHIHGSRYKLRIELVVH